ncbi:MAG: uroporphyrinogen decarboxylase family protein [Spirochaetota bacterium]
MNIQELFPADELARRREHWAQFWRNDADVRTIIAPQSGIRYTNTLDKDEARREFIRHIEVEASLGYDTLPAFKCVLGTPALASAFGGTWHRDEGGMFWIDPIIEKPEDVYRLTLPPAMSGLVKESVDIYRYVAADIGCIPPRVPDMQGPLNTASMLWRQEDFIIAMYDNPKEVHHLLSLVTDYIISVFHYFRDNFENAELVSWPNLHMPEEYGVGIIEDFTELLSPELYREFGLPYVNRIAREFNGVFIHCCARFKQHYDAFAEIYNLRGLDTMYPFTEPAVIAERFPGIVHTMGAHAPAHQQEFGGSSRSFVRFISERIPQSSRMVFMPYDSADTLDESLIDTICECRMPMRVSAMCV